MVNSLRVAVGARLCQCVGDSMCVASPGVSICVAAPNPVGFYCVGVSNKSWSYYSYL